MLIFKIGTFELPVLAGLDINQSYEEFGGESVFRAADGTGYPQQTWSRLRVTTSGAGWIPSGLQSIDRTTVQTVACVVPRTVPAVFATRQATLPTARRSDAGHQPYGLALFADGQAQLVSVTLAGDIATVANTAGAVAYAVGYFPQFQAYVFRPAISGSPSDASHSWEIVAEEV